MRLEPNIVGPETTPKGLLSFPDGILRSRFIIGMRNSSQSEAFASFGDLDIVTVFFSEKQWCKLHPVQT